MRNISMGGLGAVVVQCPMASTKTVIPSKMGSPGPMWGSSLPWTAPEGEPPKVEGKFPEPPPCTCHSVQCFMCAASPMLRGRVLWKQSNGERLEVLEIPPRRALTSQKITHKSLKSHLRIILALVEYLLCESNYDEFCLTCIIMLRFPLSTQIIN